MAAHALPGYTSVCTQNKISFHGVSKSVNLIRLLFCFTSLLPLAAGGQTIGTVTLEEGPLKLVRGASVFVAGEGLNLIEGDVLERSGSGVTQVELADGTILMLSGDSRLFFYSYPRKGAPECLLFSGWLKAMTKKAEPTDESRYLTLPLGAATADATLVMRADKEGTELFLESGKAKLGTLNTVGQFTQDRTARSGEYVIRVADSPLQASARPPATFLSKVPVAFRDTPPSRMARFKDREFEPKPERDATYEDVSDLLTLPRNWRKSFVKRFNARTRDPAFRAALDANMRLHPEWDRILHPEKYLPKKPPESAQKH